MNYDTLYRTAVADPNKIRAAVLKKAHAECAASARKKLRLAPLLSGPLAACAAFVLLVNFSAPVAYAVSEVPVLCSLARLVTFRQWDYADDAVSISGEQPAIESTGNSALEAQVNPLIAEKLAALDEKAKADAAEYKANWLAMGNDESQFVPLSYTFDYETYCAENGILSFCIRQKQTVTTNTEDTYTTLYYYNLDTTTGQSLTLADLLGENWQKQILDGVDAQIRASGDAARISYYEEFYQSKQVTPDESQMFYIDTSGRVVVVFDEGVIAPYEAGPQSFPLSAAA